MQTRYRAEAAALAPLCRRSGALRLLAVLVLSGLWLMHGVSATTEAGCHGVPVMMSMSASAAGSGSGSGSGSQTVAHAPAVAGRADTGESGVRAEGTGASGHGSPGETCLSGQPPSSHELLLGLLSFLTLFGFSLGMAPPLTQPSRRDRSGLRRRGPPGRSGRALLTTVCISRT
jgi:hypothetical protein